MAEQRLVKSQGSRGVARRKLGSQCKAMNPPKQAQEQEANNNADKKSQRNGRRSKASNIAQTAVGEVEGQRGRTCDREVAPKSC